MQRLTEAWLIEWFAVLLSVAIATLVLLQLFRIVRVRWSRSSRIAVALTFAIVIVGYTVWTVSRARWQLLGTTVKRVETARRVVALTFDDGPSDRWTPWILDLLQRENVHGTFFLIGADVDQNPALTASIAAAGHEIGNHSYTHSRMVFKSWRFVREEVEKTDRAIARAGYTRKTLFRSPYCKKFLLLPYYLWRHDRINVLWDSEPESDPKIASDAQKISDDVVQHVRPGSIVLLHLMFDSREQSRRALPDIIHRLRAQGYEFVTVSQLLAMK